MSPGREVYGPPGEKGRTVRAERADSFAGGGWRGRPGMVVIVGLALGVGASAADSFQGFGLGPQASVRVLSIFLNMAITWVGTAFLVGRATRNPRGALAAGLLVLYVAVLGYYVFGAFFGDRVHVGGATLTAVSLRWLVAATLVGPAFGLLGHLARRSDWLGITAALSLPVTAAAEVFGLLRISLDGFTIDPLREWTIIAVLVAAFVVAAWSLAAALAAGRALGHNVSSDGQL